MPSILAKKEVASGKRVAVAIVIHKNIQAISNLFTDFFDFKTKSDAARITLENATINI